MRDEGGYSDDSFKQFVVQSLDRIADALEGLLAMKKAPPPNPVDKGSVFEFVGLDAACVSCNSSLGRWDGKTMTNDGFEDWRCYRCGARLE